MRLYLGTMRYLRRDQLLAMVYRRGLRRSSRPQRAFERARIRRASTIQFGLAADTKALDRACFVGRDAWPTGPFDWRTGEMWRPLRIQLHYFDYLSDPHRPEAWKRAIVTDWVANHARYEGDGWNTYAASLRMVNWIKFFTRLPAADVDEAWLASLYGHALWLETNLEAHILANHLLKNAKALVFAGQFFAGADAERWLERGLALFLAQLREQFLADGGHYERSIMYHAISVQDVLDVFAYLSSGASVQDTTTLETLRACAIAGLDFFAAVLLPDGTIPLFNDAVLEVAPTAAELYASAKATLGYEPPLEPTGLALRALVPSGYYVIRDATNMLVIDCGPLGPSYQPGHGHCDTLSYELSLEGERVVVDTGVLDYENNEARRYARSTAAHNTVQIDGCEQSEMWDVFRVARRANALAPSLSLSGPRAAVFVGAHDGFRSSAAKAIHRRTVRYERGTWSFEDRIEGVGRHLVESRVHFRPGLTLRLADGALEITAPDERLLGSLLPSTAVGARLERVPYYPRFGNVDTASVLVMKWEGELPTTMSYDIVRGTAGLPLRADTQA